VTAKTIVHFPGKAGFFLRVFYLTEWLKILCEFFRIFWQPAGQSASYTYINGYLEGMLGMLHLFFTFFCLGSSC